LGNDEPEGEEEEKKEHRDPEIEKMIEEVNELADPDDKAT
jgi:hypothetical protein